MKFDLKRPCGNCPFIKGTSMVLAPGRMQGIADAITGDDWQVFPCHKTTHKGEEDDEGNYRSSGAERACMGALAYTYKHAHELLPVMARIAIARGELDIETVRANLAEIASPGEWQTW